MARKRELNISRRVKKELIELFERYDNALIQSQRLIDGRDDGSYWYWQPIAVAMLLLGFRSEESFRRALGVDPQPELDFD